MVFAEWLIIIWATHRSKNVFISTGNTSRWDGAEIMLWFKWISMKVATSAILWNISWTADLLGSLCSINGYGGLNWVLPLPSIFRHVLKMSIDKITILIILWSLDIYICYIVHILRIPKRDCCLISHRRLSRCIIIPAVLLLIWILIVICFLFDLDADLDFFQRFRLLPINPLPTLRAAMKSVAVIVIDGNDVIVFRIQLGRRSDQYVYSLFE